MTLIKASSWWHGLWIGLFVSGLVFRVRGANAAYQAPVDAAAGVRIGLETAAAFCLALCCALRRPNIISYFFRGLPGCMVIYGLVCLTSTAWSVYPAWTLFRSLEFLFDLLVVAATLSLASSARAYSALLNWTWGLHGLLLAWIWLGVLIWPTKALEHGVGLLGVQLNGVFPLVAANSVGEFGAIIAVVAFVRLLVAPRPESGKCFNILLLTLGLASLIFSQTRSALAGFALAAVLVVMLSERRILALPMALATAFPVILSGVRSFLWEFLSRGESEQSLRSITGRLDWWTAAWAKFLARPLTGYGAYAGGWFVVMPQLGFSETGGIHSEYVESLVGTGFWGLVPLVAALLWTWFVMLGSVRGSGHPVTEDRLTLEALGALAVVSVRSFFSQNLVWHYSMFFLAILAYAEFLRARPKSQGAPGTTIGGI